MFNKKLTKTDLGEFVELVRIIKTTQFKAHNIGQNADKFENGKVLAEQYKKEAELYTAIKDAYISQKLLSYGFKQDERVNIDPETGKITKV